MEAAIRRILVATDLSEFSPVLLREAVKLARLYHAELTVVHLFRPEDYGQVYAESQIPLGDYVEKLRAEMQFLVTGPGHLDAGIPVRFQIRMTTNVVEEIIFEAKRSSADIIVMGTRGRSGLARALLGSVAEAVLRRAPVPVFVVPTALLSHSSRIISEAAPMGAVSHG